MKNKIVYIPFICLSLCLTACPFRFDDGDEWKERYGTPELLLENAKDESCVYLYEDEKQQGIDYENIVREAIKDAAPFEESDNHSVPENVRYFTYEASWIPATTGPNYEHLSIWENGFVRIEHKSSLGPYEHLYFSVSEEKASLLVDWVFSVINAHEN